MLDVIKVGGIEYKVVFPYETETNEDVLGLHVPHVAELRVVDKIYGQSLKWCKIHETLLHELFHALEDVYCTENILHTSVTKLSTGLYQVLRDNEFNIQKFKDFPRKAKIAGHVYDVVPDCEFEDEVENPYFDVKNQTTKLFFSDMKASPSFKASCFCSAVFYALCSVYMGEDEDEVLRNNIKNLGRGIYQVLKDNDIEEIISYGIREDDKYRKNKKRV